MKKTMLIIPILLLTSCQSKNNIDDKEIIVGASYTPHSLILEQARADIESKGYKLTIKVMNDYVTPNLTLRDGDIDANYFQHQPYLTEFNNNYKTDIVSVVGIHFEPMGIYKGNKKNKKVIIPNDKSNGDRARELLKVNKYTDYEIVEMEAQTIPLMLEDCEIACVNGNYALSSQITSKLIVAESGEETIAKQNTNIIAVKKENVDKPCIKVLVEALTTEKIKNYITKEFSGTVKPMF